MKSVRQSLALLLSLTALGCAGDPPTAASARLDRLPRPLTAAEQKIIAAGNGFSFALLREINKAQWESNVFISPLSASMSLGMTLNGAAGATYDSMRVALGYGEATQAEINEGYRSLIELLRGLDPATDFRIANSIWSRQGFPFEQSFLNVGKTYFDAEVQALDFDAPASLVTINDWVRRSTNGKIPRILDVIDRDDVMFLINAIYFNGRWQYTFDRSKTQNAPFTALGGTVRPAPLMYQEAKLRYFQNSRVQAVDLLYGNGAFAMTVIVPFNGEDVNSLVGSLNEGQWKQWLDGFREQTLELFLPKFKLEYERTMNDDLTALGMGIAFDPYAADFSRMSRGVGLFIAFVKQKTYLDVYEEGTEAAAATVTGMRPTSAGTIVRVDRPFIFAIRERFSGTILFIGKIARLG